MVTNAPIDSARSAVLFSQRRHTTMRILRKQESMGFTNAVGLIRSLPASHPAPAVPRRPCASRRPCSGVRKSRPGHPVSLPSARGSAAKALSRETCPAILMITSSPPNSASTRKSRKRQSLAALREWNRKTAAHRKSARQWRYYTGSGPACFLIIHWVRAGQ